MHQQGMGTARNEISGVNPALATLALMTQIARFGDAESRALAARAAIIELDDAQRRWSADARAQTSLAEASRMAQAIAADASQAPPGAVLDVLAGALAAIGDASELILDPELTSYYLMDILISRDAQVLQALAAVRSQHARLHLSGLGASEVIVALRGYVDTLSVRTTALANAFRAFETRSPGHASLTRLEATLGRYLAALEMVELEMRNRPQSHGAVEVYERALAASFGAREEVARQLRVTLEARIGRFQTVLNRQIVLAMLMFVAAVCAMLLLIGRLVTQPLRRLTGAMLALAEGDTAAEPGVPDRSDEIGAMARAFLVFRNNAVRRAVLEEKTHKDAAALRELADTLERSSAALADAQRIGRMGNWSYRFGDNAFVWSDESFRLLGLSRGSFVPTRGAVLGLLTNDSQRLLLEAESRMLRTGATAPVDIEACRADGSIGCFTIAMTADADAEGRIRGAVGTILDITERKKAERDLEQLAYFDPLSGLANRSLFQRRLMEAVQSGSAGGRFALMMMDLDRFKEVNDSLGHQAGDELLFLISDRLQRVAPRDTLLARLGGDEFAALVPAMDEAGLRLLGETIIEVVGAPVMLSQGEVSVGVSIGIARYPLDGTGDDQLMQSADLALYRAKDAGRGVTVFFDPEFSEIAQEKIRLGRDLALALKEPDQLFLCFQAQVRAETGAVTGFEALVRWRHPERGLVPPAEFIPIAESSKLICDLGQWVLRAACQQLKAWREAGVIARPIAVNVSPAQFWLSDLEAIVATLAEEAGVAPDLLCLEVTESLFVREGDGRARRTLEALKARGFKLALDDFGTGYSSLGMLNRLPFDKIKIDRSFVIDADRDPQKAKLLEGVISIAASLDMVTVAEGAETMSELLLLSRLGCHEVQGYVFARPLPADEALAHAADIERHFGGRTAA
jgi:diguanylate cyclase (GGDEF)-like protein